MLVLAHILSRLDHLQRADTKLIGEACIPEKSVVRLLEACAAQTRGSYNYVILIHMSL